MQSSHLWRAAVQRITCRRMPPAGELQVVGELGVHFVLSRVICFPLHRGQVLLLISISLFTGSFAPFPLLRCLRQAPPDRLAGAEVDLLPLVIEVRTAVDVVRSWRANVESTTRGGSTGR